MLQNFANFVGQFKIQNPIILDSFRFSVPLLFANLGPLGTFGQPWNFRYLLPTLNH